MTAIVLIGTGGTATDTVDAIEALNADKQTYDLLGYVDDNPKLAGTTIQGYPVLGSSAILAEFSYRKVKLVITVANYRQLMIRKTIRDRLAIDDARCPAIIHPRAYISKHTKIGPGTIVHSGTQITATSVGAYVVVLANTTFPHDIEVADFATISLNVGLGGGVKVGQGAYIGLGANIFPGVTIGTESIVGLGAVVLKDVPDRACVIGNPAKQIENRYANSERVR